MAGVAVVGHLTVDITPQLPGPPVLRPGVLAQVGPAAVALGGAVGNTGRVLAVLGVPVVGTAAIGSLHAAASTTAEGFRNAGANISTGGGVEFWDFFTVTGTPGQSVQVSWRADLHGVRACSGDPELSPSGLARLTYSVFNTNPFGGGNERGDRALSACGDNTLSDSGVMYLEVGDRMQVFAHLQVSASNGDAMDAGNTARLFFDTLTPGTSLVSTSGHNYSITAVPEPGSWLLMGLGLTGLFVRQGRRGLSRSRA